MSFSLLARREHCHARRSTRGPRNRRLACGRFFCNLCRGVLASGYNLKAACVGRASSNTCRGETNWMVRGANAGFGALLLMEFRSCILSDLRSTGVLAVVRRELRPLFSELRRLYFNKVWGMDIAPGCRISFSAKLDKNYPRGIHVGESTAINFGACRSRPRYGARLHVDTWIGKECNIGAQSMILAGDQNWRQLRGRGGERGDEGRAVELPGRRKPGAHHGERHSNRPTGASSIAPSVPTSAPRRPWRTEKAAS